MEPYQHQKDIIARDRKWYGNFLGTGGGKTRVCLELAEGATLIVAPKQQVLDKTWEENAGKFGVVINMTVISKETFRRDWHKLPRFDTLIVDEGHNHLGVTPDTRMVRGVPTPKWSQIFEATKGYLEKHNPSRFYIATATPAGKPMNVWALGVLLRRWGEDTFFRFREKYYIQRKMGWRSIWIPRNREDTKEKLAELIRSMGDTGRLEDWFDVPEQTHLTHHVSLTDAQKVALKQAHMEADPMVRRAKMRTIENGIMYDLGVGGSGKEEYLKRVVRHFENEKIPYILERAQEFPKMLIFANYIGQIEAIESALKAEGYNVLTLTGETKHRGSVIGKANAAKACIVVAQCSISAGYELPSYPCVIFASKSFRYLDYDQGIGRVLRANALKKNLFIHLVVKGGVDEDCHKTILSGKDFQEKIYGGNES